MLNSTNPSQSGRRIRPAVAASNRLANLRHTIKSERPLVWGPLPEPVFAGGSGAFRVRWTSSFVGHTGRSLLGRVQGRGSERIVRGSERGARGSERIARGGFSLLEMMIAIVILGLGLLMAATMFPVGWTRARDLAEFTSETTSAETAAMTLRLLCKVEGASSTSFVGDAGPGAPDTVVHVLHIENALADPNVLPPNKELALGEWYRSSAAGATPMQSDFILVDPMVTAGWELLANFPEAQIAFHQRTIPPLPRQPLSTDTPPPSDDQIGRWNTLLDSRRFAWAVLYRFNELPTTNETRSMTFYLFTLRRTQPTHRFARQDDMAPPVTPQALDATEDMLFPVPWLIKLKILGNWIDPEIAGGGTQLLPSGVASEAVANPGASPPAEGRLIAQMLQPGSVLVDRVTGHVLKVEQHRYTGTGASFDHQATVTLDREITGSDIGVTIDTAIGPGDVLRDFWVFPPPVVIDRPEQGFVVFDGRQPVVGVETRQMFFSP